MSNTNLAKNGCFLGFVLIINVIMPKINMNTQKPHKNRIVREHEIERALEEMYASSEDEISEEEEVSGTLCNPPYDINRALDSLQNVMDADLLEVLAGDLSHTDDT